MIHILVREHNAILDYLGRLHGLNRAVQRMATYSGEREEFDNLTSVTEHLLGAEPHHQREEQILYPEMERRSASGPPQIMRLEHEELRARKRELKELVAKVDDTDFATSKERLQSVSDSIVLVLRDHILKENNILYPVALDLIRDDELWKRMKRRGDEIGYCSFTPAEAVEGR